MTEANQTSNEQLLRKALARITQLGGDDAPSNWDLVVRAMEIARKALADSPVETTGWYVNERLKDGTFRRWATAHIWEHHEDAHRQRDELAKFYPRKIFAVTSVRPAVEPTDNESK